MVRQCPEVRFVLDHIGKPGIKAGISDPWRQHLKELAALPNVHCKISGVTTEADHKNWTREQLKPYIAHAIDTFGFDRVHVWRRLACARNLPAPIRNGSRSSTGLSKAQPGTRNASSSATMPSASIGSTARMSAPVPAWRRRGYSIAPMRDLARAALPQPDFRFRRWRRRRRAYAAAQRERLSTRSSLLPRPLTGAAPRDLSITLFGKTFSMPVVIGPTGLAGLFWPDGERCAARAAQAAGTAFCLSHGSVCTLEDLAAPAQRRAGCRSSSTRTAASPAN